MDEWQQDFTQISPLFEPLRGVGESLENLDRWPTLAELNALLPPSIRTAGGAAIRFVPQAGRPRCMEEQYEARIHTGGEVQTRTENWHDLFNALVWLAFPRAKAAINARHFSALCSENAGNRCKVRDALTLFDESGVIVACADDDLAGLLRGFQWRQLFWEQRQPVRERMKFALFGHSLYEKALRPYLGFTGKGLLIRVEAGFFSLPLEVQRQILDERLVTELGAPAFSSRSLTPVPLLGVPGWWKDNERESFYENTGYFRHKPPERN